MSRAVEETNRAMLRARDAMDRAYAEPLDIPALAKIAHVSQAHFIRTFREGERRWAAYSLATGLFFAAAWLALIGSGGHPAAMIGFALAVVAGWAWVSVTLSRTLRVARAAGDRPAAGIPDVTARRRR